MIGNCAVDRVPSNADRCAPMRCDDRALRHIIGSSLTSLE
jgi:hypothetical protein